MANPLLPISSSSSVAGSSVVGGAPAYPNGLGRYSYDTGMTPRSGRGVPVMLRRLTKFRSMDFELAFWQLTYLVVAPRRVYKQTYHHKQTKNVWARDDPAMIVLIAGCLAVAGLAWSLVYKQSASAAIYIILRMIFRDFLLSSLVVAGLLYIISNRLLLAPSSSSAIDNRVEFAYAFDVAVNSFFPLVLTLYAALLPLAPVVVRNNWVCLLVGNTLFLIAGIQYWYVMYLGYAALPFVARSEILIAPILPIIVGWLLSLLGFNVARHALELYFGRPW
ncbi:transport-related protein [Papiliotrema laurentii]|uniref:Transport-related protein n=1 Tax=Papiliotrema laurentii TaxID=5418 RepID=A0AAD9CVG8_PAPLA|nr:transport-related protein [Papiliotrema laurentii]